ncbi:MAG: MaoC family dehydratase [Bdellovibrionota bacterium]
MKVKIFKGFTSSMTVKVTDKMIHQFAEMCGDFNPIHLDEEYAKKTRFGRRIAHGMIVGALFSRALNETMGEGGVYLAQSMKFTSPVYIDDVITIHLQVMNMRTERGMATVETLAKKENGEICVKGEAIIMVADGVQK